MSSLLVLGASGLGSTLLAACATDDGAGAGTSGGNEAGSDGSARPDGASPGNDANDAATRGSDAADAGADGPLIPCAFNRECSASMRCECSETDGCACKPGARGTGRNGLDPCIDGNACASSLCVEGPPDSGSFCSDECDASTDCKGQLPVCADIALVGRICIRTPPK